MSGVGPSGDGSPTEAAEGTFSWRQLLAEAERRLVEVCAEPSAPGHGSIDPATVGLDARWIVERAAGFEGRERVLRLDEPATRRGAHLFDVMLDRRLVGEPLQYVLGRWGFRTLDLVVDHRALIPRPDTEVVVEATLAELDRLTPAARAGGRAPVVVDLGTGTGAIALSVAVERAGTEVWATDASPAALDLARANLAGTGRAATRVRLAAGDWFGALPPELAGCVDVVVSNPPYVAEDDVLPAVVADWEPIDALRAGPEGLDDLEVIVADAAPWLVEGGALVVELDPRQAATVAERAAQCGFATASVVTDLAGRERAVVARR